MLRRKYSSDRLTAQDGMYTDAKKTSDVIQSINASIFIIIIVSSSSGSSSGGRVNGMCANTSASWRRADCNI